MSSLILSRSLFDMLPTIKKITKNLSKNMLIYTLLTIILGTAVSCVFSPTFLAKYMRIVVFLMIYPMIVNVSFESLKKIKTSYKAIGLALIYNFVVAPIIYYSLCNLFNAPSDIITALLFLSIAPASSMGIGYVGLAEGNVSLASVITAFAFIIFLVISPFVIYFLGSAYYTSVIGKTIENLIFVLVLPLVFGILTRELIIERKGIKFEKVKPFFSLITLTFLYVLIFMIFAIKGKLIITHPYKVLTLIPLAILFYALMLTIEYIINKHIIRLGYEDFQAIIFTTVSKNVALTIALLTVVFGKHGYIMAIYPAIVSIFQILFLVTYLHLSLKVLKKK